MISFRSAGTSSSVFADDFAARAAHAFWRNLAGFAEDARAALRSLNITLWEV
jgi:hypothetical protein